VTEASERFEQAARDLLAAAAKGDELGVRRAAGALGPEIARMARSVATRQSRLAEKVGLSADDLAQHIGLRILQNPPTSSEGKALPTVLAWMRTVAANWLLTQADRSEVKTRERPRKDEDAPSAIDLEPSRDRGAEEALGMHQEVAQLRECARRSLGKYKHLYEVFEMLAEESDVPALELALRLEIVTLATEPNALRKGVQQAWQLRHRALTKLAECMGVDRKKARQKKEESS
jgi:hypothetical protein